MSSDADRALAAGDRSEVLAGVLGELAQETARLAEQCGLIQWSISKLLDTFDHPDLGAEIHMIQDIDRIHQTLEDVASVLAVAVLSAEGAPIRRVDFSSAIQLESLRQRMGLSNAPPAAVPTDDNAEITWL